MEQQFQLKHYGNLSLFEQNQMTAEERAWYVKRIDKEQRDQNEKQKQQSSSMPTPRVPHISRPSVPRR